MGRLNGERKCESSMEWHESLDVGSTTVKLVVLDEKKRERVNRKKKEPLSQFAGRKNGKLFSREGVTSEEATRGKIGIPCVLNMYENYPF